MSVPKVDAWPRSGNTWIVRKQFLLRDLCALLQIRKPVPFYRSMQADMPESVDVVIIGAGLAGLTAAREVTKAGYSCVVLEARARVGGRTYTHTLDKGIVDLGAAWINDTNQSQIFALAEELKLELIEQNTTGNAVLLDHDGSAKPFPYGELPPVSADVSDMVQMTAPFFVGRRRFTHDHLLQFGLAN
jgi:NADPH-dependent 2,4-dienoyl-CoA reductase/sulfur reductase-like enzyme